jgi:hypothetical protein
MYHILQHNFGFLMSPQMMVAKYGSMHVKPVLSVSNKSQRTWPCNR